MKIMKKVALLMICMLTFFTLTSESGCSNLPDSSNTVQNKEQRTVEGNQEALMVATPLPIITKSLERIAISRRIELFQDENKISYIYLTSFGKVMAFYIVKGKVTSGNKRLTSNEKIVSNDVSTATYDKDYQVVESPSLDGTYGTSGDYIFFWTTDGTYVQWNDTYMLCDKPLKLTTQPELVREIQ